jgi:hypothetical protein
VWESLKVVMAKVLGLIAINSGAACARIHWSEARFDA